MKIIKAIPIFLFVSCAKFSSQLDTVETRPQITMYEGYDLVWNEEFEIEGQPNVNEWTFERGFKRNKELQWYQQENAFCEQGKLIIEGRKELRPNPTYLLDGADWKRNRKNITYTSASLKSKSAWQYGRFEIRAKIKAEQGLWPAIWFLGEYGQWPHNGEIDLMEYYQNQILANACWGTKNNGGLNGIVRKHPCLFSMTPIGIKNFIYGEWTGMMKKLSFMWMIYCLTLSTSVKQ